MGELIVMRLIVLGAAALALSGCMGLPPAVTVASLALDGASWAVSGKTISDHALSEVAGADCQLIGILEDGRFCREAPTFEESQVATLHPLPGTGTRMIAAPATGATPPAGKRSAGAAAEPGPDPMGLPPGYGYLSDALGGRGIAEHPSAAGVPLPVATGFARDAGAAARSARGFTGRTQPRDPLAGMAYHSAGLVRPG